MKKKDIKTLRLKDLSTRDQFLVAADVAAKKRDPRTIEWLIDALKVNEVLMHAAAIEALTKMGSLAIGPLSDALKDRNVDVREGSAEVLGEIGDVRAVKPLMAALKDRDVYVRRAVAEALEKLGWQPGNDDGQAGSRKR